MSKVTDEPFDALVHRPLAGFLVKAIAPFSVITPNHVTLGSMALGVGAGACFASTSGEVVAAGGIALFASMVLDCGDGQLARIRGGGTLVGRVIDGLADYVVAIAVHVGMLVGLIERGMSIHGHRATGLELFVLMLAAGVSMSINAGRFDLLKWQYLAATEGVEPESPGQYREAATHAGSCFERACLEGFALYLNAQKSPEERAHEIERLRRSVTDRKEFILDHEQALRLWRLTGPTMHNTAVVLAALATLVFPLAAFGYVVFALVVVNVYAAGVSLWLHARARRTGLCPPADLY